MTAFAQHFAFEFRTGVRSATLMFMNYLFPLGLYLMLGFIMPGLNEAFLENMIPAMITVAVMAAALLGITRATLYAKVKQYDIEQDSHPASETRCEAADSSVPEPVTVG